MKFRTAILLAMSCHALVAPATGHSAQASATQPYTAEAMWQLQRLATPAISPDGRVAVVAVSRFDVARNEEYTHLWLVPTRPGRSRQLTSGANRDTSPVWSPDGRWVAFVSQRGDDRQPQIYIIAVDGGEARRITNVPTGAAAPKWFPDSERVAFVSKVWPEISNWRDMARRLEERERSQTTARVWDHAPIAERDAFLDDRSHHLYWVSIEGGEPNPITTRTGYPLHPAPPDPAWYDISPDGLEVAYAGNVDRTGTRPDFDILLTPVEGGTVTNLSAAQPADDLAPRFSPDGRLLAYQRGMIVGSAAARSHLVLLDRRTGATRDLTEAWDRSADNLVWAPDGRSLFGTVEDAGTRRVFRFDTAGGPPTPITAESSYSDLAIAGNGPVIVALRSSFNEPPTLVSVIARTGAPTKLADFNDVELAALTQGRSESVAISGPDGVVQQMWLTYPPGYTTERRWPVLMLLHPGPHRSVVNATHWEWNAQVFANWGYVVAAPNFRGSTGFGERYAEQGATEWSGLPVGDVLAATAWLEQQPWVDRARLTALGAGFGGYLAAILQSREHPFKTFVAHAPIYDLYAQYAADHGSIQRRHGEHWQDAERYARNSPHLRADRFATPMLLTHGEQDMRVPVTQSIALFNTLQNRGIESRLVLFPGEQHSIRRPQSSLYWHEAVREWLHRHAPAGPGEPAPTPPQLPATPSN